MPSDKRARQRAMRELKLAEQERKRKRSSSLRKGAGAVVVVAVVVGLVVLLSSGGSPKKKTTAASATTGTSASAPASTTTSSTVPGTPATAPVSHTAVAPVCPPATPAGAAKRLIAFTKAPPTCISPTGVYDATVATNAGTFVVRMDAKASLAAVNNFVFLARYHYFDLTVFHRVIPGFVVQGGDPTGTGAGGPGYSFTGNTPPPSCKAKADCYPVGGVAMANSSGPSTNGSQFFVILPGCQTTLDQEPNYTLFGRVVSGMPVVEKIGAAGSSSGTPKVLYHIVKVTIT
ncbi:MAG: peptidylprolyl isomerase, partial [Acidimicrobiales bacterium]